MVQRHAPAEAQLTFKPLHGAGNCTIAFTRVGSEVLLLTGGADGRVALRTLDTLEERAAYVAANPLGCVAVDSNATVVAIASDADTVLLSLPSLTFKSQVGSDGYPVHALAFSPDGSQLATAGDGSDIRVHGSSPGLSSAEAAGAATSFKSDPYVRSLAWDPAGIWLAATEAPGYLAFFELSKPGSRNKKRSRRLPKIDPTTSTRSCAAWHPNGSMVAVPGLEGQVVLYDPKFDENETSYLTEGHTSNVTAIAFSPNGLYVASGSTCGKLCVWDVRTKTAKLLASATPAPEPPADAAAAAGGAAEAADGAAPAAAAGGAGPAAGASSLAWHPEENILVVADEAGRLSVWHNPIPAGLAGPSEDREAAPALPAVSGAPFGSVLSGGMDLGAGGDGAEMDDDLGEFIEDDLAEERGAKGRGGRGGGGGRREIVRVIERAPAGPPPQAPIQSGSTPVDPLAAGPNRGCRFLTYNMLGFISAGPGLDEDCASVDISIHDTTKVSCRLPVLSDPWGITLASLGSSGALHASPTTLIYRPFDNFSSRGIWTAALPEHETATCVAAGAGFCAASTSRQLLRCFSPSGAQTAVLSLPGPAVALSAEPEGARLAVVTHAAPPDPVTRSQCLLLQTYDMTTSSRLDHCPLALSPGSTLTWLAFTSEGLPCTADSDGVVRVRSPQFGGCWLPVWDPAAQGKGQEVYWPVGVSALAAGAAAGTLTCVVCARAAPHPALHPRPIFTRVGLLVPVLAVEGGKQDLESELLLHGVGVAVTRQGLEAARAGGEEAAGLEGELGERLEAEDKCLLRNVHQALEDDCQGRCLELSDRMHGEKFLEGAIRLANFKRMARLAESIGDLLQARREQAAVEAEAAAAAVEAQAQAEEARLYSQAQAPEADEEVQEVDAGGAGGSGSGTEPLGDVTGSKGNSTAAAAAAKVGPWAPRGVKAGGAGGGAGASSVQKGAGEGGGKVEGAGAVKRKLVPAGANPFARKKAA